MPHVTGANSHEIEWSQNDIGIYIVQPATINSHRYDILGEIYPSTHAVDTSNFTNDWDAE